MPRAGIPDRERRLPLHAQVSGMANLYVTMTDTAIAIA